jgi:hypothetical protein
MTPVAWEYGSAHRTLPELRTHLQSVGICRPPNTAGAAPPMHLEPATGVPAAGEGAGAAVGPTLVLGAFLASGVVPDWGEGYSRRQIIDVWIRAKATDSWRGPAVAAAIEREVAPPPYAARHEWTMGGLLVIESRLWRPLQPVGSDAQGWTWTMGLYIETYREAS